MALSGTIYSGTFGPSGHYKLRMTWTATQSVTNNTSTVTVQMALWSDSSWSMYTSTSHSGNISIDPSGSVGVTNHAISSSINTNGGVWVNLGSAQSQTITHNSDGTMSFVLDGDFNFTGITVSGTAMPDEGFTATTCTLDTIPRASTISSSVSWTAGTSNLGVTLATASSSFHHTLTLQVQDTTSTWHTVATRTSIGSSTTMSFTNSEITNMYTYINGYENRPATLYVDTYDSSNNHIGSQQSKTGTMYAVATAITTFGTSNKWTLSTSLPYNITSGFILGASDQTTWSYDFVLTLGSFTKTWTNSYLQSGNLTLTSTEVDSMYGQMTTANSKTGTIRTRMYYNSVSTEDGNPTSDTTTVTFNTDVSVCAPTFTPTITYKDNDSKISGVTGSTSTIVQNQSDLYVTSTGLAVGQKSATISSYTCTVNGVAVQAAVPASGTVVNFDMGKVNSGTNNTISVTAIDSRGNTVTKTSTFTLLPYSPPVVSTSSTRASGFDVAVTTTCSGSFTSIKVATVEKNGIASVKYQFKKTTTSTYPTTGAGSPTAFVVTATGTTFSTTAVYPDDGTGVGGLDNTASWNVQVIVTDNFGNTASYLTNTASYNIGNSVQTNTVAAGIPILFVDSSLKSVGVGKFPTNSNALELAGDIYMTNGSIRNVKVEEVSGGTGDLNSLAGKFQVQRTANTTVNRPTSYTSVVNIPLSVNSDFQIGVTYDGANRMFIRGRHDTDASWTAWTELGGIDTSGSNTNGSYIKYADGTMICWASIAATAGTSLQNTGLLTYPVTFTAAPYTTVQHYSLSGKFANWYIYNNASNGFTLYHQGVGGSPTIDLTGTSFRWIAIGKWK